MDELPAQDDTFRPASRRRKVATAVAAVTMAAIGVIAALSYATYVPRLEPDEPVETTRVVPPTDRLFSQPSAPSRMAVTTALPEGIPAGGRKVARQTVVVENAYGNRGSGFMLRPGVLLTAAHIADREDRENRTLKVRCEPIETEAEVLVVDYLRDVLVARVDCVASPLKIDGAAYREATGLYYSGFNFGPDAASRYFTPTSALPDAVFAPNDDRLSRLLAQARARGYPPPQGFDSVVIPGNSGSPVFTSEGVVVGMVVFIDGANARSFMVPAASLLAALDAAQIKR